MSDSARPAPHFLSCLNPLALGRTLVAQRALARQFTVRNFHARHKGNYLGLAWAVLSPLLLLGLYFIVFELFFGAHFNVANATPVDDALALLLGLTVFRFVGDIIAESPMVIVANPNLVKKVVFPVEILPLANMGACFFNFAISMALVLLGMCIFGRGIPLTTAWMPVIIVPVVLLGAGFSWLLAALGVFFRDISQLTQFLSILLMYLSAVFYPSSLAIQKAPGIWAIIRFNPVLQVNELLRNAMLWHQPVNLSHVVWLYVGCTAICMFGYACFALLRSTFADVL
jgi:lipopolysaccharide transport system permease protein